MQAMLCRKRRVENKRKKLYRREKKIGQLKQVISSLRERGEREEEEFLEVN